MSIRQWIIKTIDRERQDALSRALSISPVTASVLLGRGVQTTEEAHRWLTMATSSPHDPMRLPDMERAIARLHGAVEQRERICFYGDYDVDGVTSVSLFLSYFQRLGGQRLFLHSPPRAGRVRIERSSRSASPCRRCLAGGDLRLRQHLV